MWYDIVIMTCTVVLCGSIMVLCSLLGEMLGRKHFENRK